MNDPDHEDLIRRLDAHPRAEPPAELHGRIMGAIDYAAAGGVAEVLSRAVGGSSVIKGLHAMFYSSKAAELRAFFRDKLGLEGTDVGDGWLIFDAPEADLGVHPAENDGAPSGTADISFYCDDIHQTVRELKSRGVEFTQDVEDHGYGLVTHFKVPGGFSVQLYQPKYRK